MTEEVVIIQEKPELIRQNGIIIDAKQSILLEC